MSLIEQFRKQYDEMAVGTTFCTEFELTDKSLWIGYKAEDGLIWLDNDANIDIENRFQPTDIVMWGNNTLVHVFERDQVHQVQKCSCDLRTVIMVTGCRCGGT